MDSDQVIKFLEQILCKSLKKQQKINLLPVCKIGFHSRPDSIPPDTW